MVLLVQVIQAASNRHEEEKMSSLKAKAQLYQRYPLSSILIYNGSTVLHFLVGGIGIMVGYRFTSWAGYLSGWLYLIFSFVEMYVIMPLVVCPNCVYSRLEDSLCISGLNAFSKRIAREGNSKDFPKRAKGFFCSNNLYMVSLIAPVAAMIPALILRFSSLLLVLFLGVVGLVVFRFFVIFPRIACLHCRAKYACPQAGAMGVREL